MNLKLPLRWGLLGLLGVWVAHSLIDDPQGRLLLLVLGMLIALWTAFSLSIPPRQQGLSGPHLQVHEEADETPRIGPLGDSLGPRIVPDPPEENPDPAQDPHNPTTAATATEEHTVGATMAGGTDGTDGTTAADGTLTADGTANQDPETDAADSKPSPSGDFPKY